MSKYPFSPSGFINVQSELYDLTASELVFKLTSISCSIIDWIKGNFVLEARQITHLDQINPQVIDFITSQTLFAVKNRLPIYLDRTGKRDCNDQGKLIKPTSNLTAISENGNFLPGGEFIIEINYI